MKKLTAVAAVVIVLAVGCGGGSGTKIAGGKGAPLEPIKIGVVGPMTGLAGFVGKNMVEGIQLAVEDLNKKGVLGRQVEFVMRDDENDPAKTATAVRELIEKERVSALFGPAGSTNYLSVSRIIEDNQIPSWVISSGAELSDRVNPYAVRAYIPDSPEVLALAEFASKRYSRIAIISSNDGDGTGFVEGTKAALAKFGKTPVATESFALDETDFSPILLKIKNANAAKNLDVGAKLLGLAGLINYTYPDLARDAADGTVFVSFRSWGHLPKDQWPASVRTFYDAYVKRFLPEGEFSETGAYRAYSTNFLTYDMVKIWAAAAEEAKSAEPKDVGDLLNAGFAYPAEDSVIGVPWSYTATDHDGIRPGDLYFYRWEFGADKRFVLKFHGTVTDVLAGRSSL
jgi:branched-chain amino acid transport system substrate-binding protein